MWCRNIKLCDVMCDVKETVSKNMEKFPVLKTVIHWLCTEISLQKKNQFFEGFVFMPPVPFKPRLSVWWREKFPPFFFNFPVHWVIKLIFPPAIFACCSVTVSSNLYSTTDYTWKSCLSKLCRAREHEQVWHMTGEV